VRNREPTWARPDSRHVALYATVEASDGIGGLKPTHDSPASPAGIRGVSEIWAASGCTRGPSPHGPSDLCIERRGPAGWWQFGHSTKFMASVLSMPLTVGMRYCRSLRHERGRRSTKSRTAPTARTGRGSSVPATAQVSNRRRDSFASPHQRRRLRHPALDRTARLSNLAAPRWLTGRCAGMYLQICAVRIDPPSLTIWWASTPSSCSSVSGSKVDRLKLQGGALCTRCSSGSDREGTQRQP
jgi:hypothetical protein